jgi:hypothetical protein
MEENLLQKTNDDPDALCYMTMIPCVEDHQP